VDRAHIHNVLNGVDLPAPGRTRKRPERPELLFVGRAGDPNKGLEYLLAALPQLPAEVRLRCLSVRPLKDDPIHSLIGSLGISERVRFEGKVPRAELELAYRDAAIVVLPSLFEGFGLPAIEALAAGTPVVATRAGALPEVLGQAGLGRQVPLRDPEALADAIRDVLERWEQEQHAVVAARDHIERSFGWPEVARRTAEVYAEVERGWRASGNPLP
jgi:glycosyltransferase involved in cell wall biosynthesis